MTSGADSSIIREQERMQSSSAYAVPKNLTESGEFRSKFNSMDSDKRVQRQYYQVAKEMLRHRSGTNGEDLYFYNTRTKKWYRSTGEIVSFHNHPLGMPPSAGDLNAALKNGYQKRIYTTQYVRCKKSKIYKKGCSEFEVQLNTLLELKELFQFDVREVK